MIKTCQKKQIDLLLIAGDLFHRQPLLRELKEVCYLFEQLEHTQVVMIVGNHDYLKKDSYYQTFQWPTHVHIILNDFLTKVDLPDLNTSVYGFSYHTKEIQERPYEAEREPSSYKRQILLLHGGDELHVPLQKDKLLQLGYDYIALGHIHKPRVICPDKIAYCGALEPIDKNDTGEHGYILGEFTEQGCKAQFIASAKREYRHMEIPVTTEMTSLALKEKIREAIEETGTQHIYKIILTGFREPQMLFDLGNADVYGNIIEISDQTKPAYDFEKLMEQNASNILGYLIRDLKDYDEESVEYRAMCEGVRALMETRKD